MGKWLIILASALWLFGTAAEAQQSPLPGELVPTRRLNLTMEDRHVIRELIKDLKLVPAATSAKAVGEAVAPDAALRDGDGTVSLDEFNDTADLPK